jgi:hypothetical protein
MSILSSQDRHFTLIDGNVLTSGGSLNIANGQLAVINASASPTQNGRKVLGDFKGLPKDTDFQIKVGKTPVAVNRNQSDKDYESLPFKLSEIVDYKVYAPKEKGIKVDEFIIGYNGKAGTELKIEDKSSTQIDITLCGEPMNVLGYHNGEVTLTLHLEAPYTDADGNPLPGEFATMQERVEAAVRVFNNMTLLGGVPVTDYVDVVVVNSENGAIVGGTDFTFFNLTLFDNGDFTSLGKVQAQYPTFKVVKTDRINDEQSVYTIIAPAGTSLDAYVTSLAQILKGCEDCPAGYSEIEAGVVYSVAIEDEGNDLTTTVDDLPGFVTGSVVKTGQVGSTGYYTVVVDNALTDAEIAAFIAVAGAKSTAIITLIGDVNAVCENTTEVETSWVAGKTCTAIEKLFTITLADDECGNDKLAELQAQYPDLSIAVLTENLSRTITLTGTSGTANVNIGGVNYLATFATDLDTTATNFVTAHAAAILAATGATVTAGTASLVVVAPYDSFPSLEINNVTTNLAGTIAAAVGSGANVASLCQTTYRASVLSDLVCEECADEFRALFEAEAPAPFGVNPWESLAPAFSATAKMGIKFKGKEFVMSGNEQFRDEMPFYATSTRLKIAGGQPQMIAESWNATSPFAVKVLSIAAEPEALGGHLWDYEDRARVYFDGEPRLEGNNYGKWILGQETRLKGLAQYVDYVLTVDVKKHYQYLPHASERIAYHVLVEVGRHENIENLLNKLASAAGLPAQQAFAK